MDGFITCNLLNVMCNILLNIILAILPCYISFHQRAIFLMCNNTSHYDFPIPSLTEYLTYIYTFRLDFILFVLFYCLFLYCLFYCNATSGTRISFRINKVVSYLILSQNLGPNFREERNKVT